MFPSIHFRSLSYSDGALWGKRYVRDLPCKIRTYNLTKLHPVILTAKQGRILPFVLVLHKKEQNQTNRKQTTTDERTGKTTLCPASYMTFENGSKMKQKLNVSNTNTRGRTKEMLGMNTTGYWLALQVYRCCGQYLWLHVKELKLQQRKTSLGEESILTEEKNDKML